jgi:hypothetical protein
VHAGLPEAIRAIPVRERARHASFREYLRQVFESVPFRRFHPEADLENCTPAFVVADALEAARVIVGGALRPSDPEPCPEGEGRFDR